MDLHVLKTPEQCLNIFMKCLSVIHLTIRVENRTMEILSILILSNIFANVSWIFLGLWGSKKYVSRHGFHWKYFHEDILGTNEKLNQKRNDYNYSVSRRVENHLKIYHMFSISICCSCVDGWLVDIKADCLTRDLGL